MKMKSDLPDPDRSNRSKLKRLALLGAVLLTLVCGVFFLGLVLVAKNSYIQKILNPVKPQKYEVFGFAPYWTLNKLDGIDWGTLTTFAYFSLPVGASGAIDRNSYEWQVFESKKLAGLFEKARSHNIENVVTLSQMDAGTIEVFLSNPSAWEKAADESVEILKNKNLDGVNIDFEYIPANDYLKNQFSSFITSYTKILHAKLDNPYVTVSVLASSARFNRIYDIATLSRETDGVLMMAYDFYYPGSETIGPTAPLYGYGDGKGPFWYDVSTAVNDFLKVADSQKIILGSPYYGWNYPAQSPTPQSVRSPWQSAVATTNDNGQSEKLLLTTPVAGWDDQAKVAWRGYWDNSGWHVVYVEDKKSLSYKYDFAISKKLKGVGLWALGYEGEGSELWTLLHEKFAKESLAQANNNRWIF